MKIFILISLTLACNTCFTINSQAQSTAQKNSNINITNVHKIQRVILLYRKNNNGNSYFVSDSDKIKIITKNGEKLEGKPEFIDNKSIQLEGKIINIEKISKIKKPRKNLRIFGGIFGSLTAIVIPLGVGGGDPTALIWEPFYASPLYLLGASKTFDLERKYDIRVLSSHPITN